MQTIVIYMGADNEVERKGFQIMGACFSKAGYHVEMVDFRNENHEIMERLRKIDWENVYFSLDVNGLATQIPLTNGKYLYEMLDFLHISLLTDAPYNPYTSMMRFPCRKQAVLYLDLTHRFCIDEMYSHKYLAKMFMPWGGYSDHTFEEIISAKRDLEVVYCATYGFENRRTWHDFPIANEIIKILDDIADYLEAYPESVYRAAQIVLQQRGMEDGFFLRKIQPFFQFLFMYIKVRRRMRSLELALKNDLRIDVFGAGWENAPFADQLTLHGRVDYDTTLELFARAKIVYQDMAEFNHGGHDRVFTAMLNGAVVVSEYSSYLAQEFNDGEDIFFYDWQNGEQQIRVIHELLADEPKRLSAAVSAYSKADKRHRWENRAQQILQFAALHESKPINK